MPNRLTDEQIAAQIRAKTEAMKNVTRIYRNTDPETEVGNLSGMADPWVENHHYEAGELFDYKGTLGATIQAVDSLEIYPPFSTGTEALYSARPPQDGDGVYSYMYTMRVDPGMRVRENGVVYVCIAASKIEPLLYPPSAAPALFNKETE